MIQIFVISRVLWDIVTRNFLIYNIPISKPSNCNSDICNIAIRKLFPCNFDISVFLFANPLLLILLFASFPFAISILVILLFGISLFASSFFAFLPLALLAFAVSVHGFTTCNLVIGDLEPIRVCTRYKPMTRDISYRNKVDLEARAKDRTKRRNIVARSRALLSFANACFIGVIVNENKKTQIKNWCNEIFE